MESTQRTIKSEVIIEGNAWYTGEPCSLKCLPSTHGITIQYRDVVETLNPKHINWNEQSYTMSLLIGGAEIFMVEHFFSALHGLGLDNIHIEFGSTDVPFCASAQLFTEKILSSGLVDLGIPKDYIIIDREIEIIDNDKICRISPADTFSVDAKIIFSNIIGTQRYKFIESPNQYLKELAEARSFLIFEISDEGTDPWLNYGQQFKTFPKTFSSDPAECSFISYTKDRYLTPLRYSDEPVRHKIVDFLGDLYFLGRPIKGAFAIEKSGHSFHRKIVDRLKELYFD